MIGRGMLKNNKYEKDTNLGWKKVKIIIHVFMEELDEIFAACAFQT